MMYTDFKNNKFKKNALKFCSTNSQLVNLYITFTVYTVYTQKVATYCKEHNKKRIMHGKIMCVNLHALSV